MFGCPDAQALKVMGRPFIHDHAASAMHLPPIQSLIFPASFSMNEFSASVSTQTR